MAKIGLIAGKGKITALFADAAKRRGDIVIALALRGCTDESLASRVDRIEWFEWGQFHKAVLFGLSQGLRKIVLLGKLEKEKFFDGSQAMDGEFKELVTKSRDRKDLSLLTNVADIIKKVGVEIIPCTDYLPELVPQAGVLTSRKPSKDELADIDYGKELARQLAGLEIGQTIAVKDKTVVSIEAVEGTDAAIKRAGELCKTGFVVLKMARPKQDMRFDVPLIGLKTIETLVDAGGTCLALESGKTLLIDKDEMIAFADRHNVSITIIQ